MLTATRVPSRQRREAGCVSAAVGAASQHVATHPEAVAVGVHGLRQARRWVCGWCTSCCYPRGLYSALDVCATQSCVVVTRVCVVCRSVAAAAAVCALGGARRVRRLCRRPAALATVVRHRRAAVAVPAARVARYALPCPHSAGAYVTSMVVLKCDVLLLLPSTPQLVASAARRRSVQRRGGPRLQRHRRPRLSHQPSPVAP